MPEDFLAGEEDLAESEAVPEFEAAEINEPEVTDEEEITDELPVEIAVETEKETIAEPLEELEAEEDINPKKSSKRNFFSDDEWT